MRLYNKANGLGLVSDYTQGLIVCQLLSVSDLEITTPQHWISPAKVQLSGTQKI
jgi:hypothetical protein